MFAKIKLIQTPKIIYNKFFLDLPTNVGRNIGKLKVIFLKKNKFYNSFYLKMIRLWNTLQNDIRLMNNCSDFLDCMHKRFQVHQYKKHNLFNYDTEIDNIYLKLRLQCSKLNADQFKFNFINNSKCLQCQKNKEETIHHYFMDCTKYNNHRQILKNNISSLHEKFMKLTNKQIIQIIQGTRDNDIEDYIYKNIYQYIKLYVVTTGRFADWTNMRIIKYIWKWFNWLQGTHFLFNLLISLFCMRVRTVLRWLSINWLKASKASVVWTWSWTCQVSSDMNWEPSMDLPSAKPRRLPRFAGSKFSGFGSAQGPKN